MAKNKNEKLPKNEEVAERSYQPENYHSSNEVEQGLATTHEQVSDMYVEGTIDGKIEDVEGDDITLPKGNNSEDIFKDN